MAYLGHFVQIHPESDYVRMLATPAVGRNFRPSCAAAEPGSAGTVEAAGIPAEHSPVAGTAAAEALQVVDMPAADRQILSAAAQGASAVVARNRSEMVAGTAAEQDSGIVVAGSALVVRIPEPSAVAGPAASTAGLAA